MINFLLYLDCLLLEKLMTNNSKCYKRPVAIRRANLSPNDQKFDLAYVLKHLRPPPLSSQFVKSVVQAPSS